MARHAKVVRKHRTINDPANEGRGFGAFTPRRSRSAAKERVRKLEISHAMEVPRGLRAGTYHERQRLEFASPRQIAEARAKTGSILRPKFGKGGQINAARKAAGGFRTNRLGITGSYLTFGGKRRASFGVEGTQRGAKLTALGRWYAKNRV